MAVKLRGMPFQVIEEDIVGFFDGYQMVPGSIKIEKGDGDRITGFGAVVF